MSTGSMLTSDVAFKNIRALDPEVKEDLSIKVTDLAATSDGEESTMPSTFKPVSEQTSEL